MTDKDYSNNKKKLLVSGPVNTIRLEGKIGDINKVLYVMFDFHLEIEQQTQCKDIRAKHITNFLVDNFDRITGSDKIYDFFLEITPGNISYAPQTDLTKMYLLAIRQAFIKSFIYDPKKSKVVMSKTFPNIRFHYIDIRDFILLEVDQIFNSLEQHIDDIYHIKQISKQDISDLMDGINIAVAKLKVIYDLIYGKDSFNNNEANKKNLSIIPSSFKSLVKYTPSTVTEINRVVINKITGNQKYEAVTKVFNSYISTTHKKNFHTLLDKLGEMYKYLADVKDTIHKIDYLYYNSHDIENCYTYEPDFVNNITIISKLYSMFFIIGDLQLKLMNKLVDFYFLRRFLNKDYITNSLVYAGAWHSMFYVYMLVKHFNFKITHASYCSKDISKINDIIKEESLYCNMHQYFLPPKLNQCSDLTNFPPLFE